ncbi:MAG: hypothetical protein HZB44_10685 [Actinobacteria bacterium]|nr:hypothetical protein [Actinomycetota bacterium]
MKTRARRGITLTLAYLVIALVMTEPLVFHFGGFSMAGLEDGSMSVWNLWWMKYSLVDLGQSPLFTDYLFYPEGVSLTFHSMPKVQGLFGIPLQYLAGLTIAYNIIFMTTFLLTALAAYWLVYHLLGERLPAFIAGILFTYCPVRWAHLGHTQLLSTMLIPVYILLVIKGREALEAGGKRPWTWFILAGLALAVTAYDTEYYAVFMLFFSVVYFFFYFPPGWKPELFRRWGMLFAGLIVAVAVFAALFSPMLLAVQQELAASGDYFTFPPSAVAKLSADLLSFFVPPVTMQFLGEVFDFTPISDTTFLGWLPLLFAVVGVVAFRRRRDTWLWVITAVLFASMALGPHVVIYRETTSIPGPYLLLTKMPLVNSVRVPGRFTVIVMLAVSILAAYGFSALFRYIRGREWHRLAVPVAVALILLGIFIEFKPLYVISSNSAPPVYTEIAASGTNGSVITLPMGWEGGDDLTGMERTYTQLFQTESHKPMLGGMVARAPKELLFSGLYAPVVDFLADPVRLEPSDLDRDPAAVARFRERYDVAFIVAHKLTPELFFKGEFAQLPSDLTPESLDKVDRYVTDYLDMEKFAETDEIIAWRRR